MKTLLSGAAGSCGHGYCLPYTSVILTGVCWGSVYVAKEVYSIRSRQEMIDGGLLSVYLT